MTDEKINEHYSECCKAPVSLIGIQWPVCGKCGTKCEAHATNKDPSGCSGWSSFVDLSGCFMPKSRVWFPGKNDE